jgi:hypothetical protein
MEVSESVSRPFWEFVFAELRMLVSSHPEVRVADVFSSPPVDTLPLSLRFDNDSGHCWIVVSDGGMSVESHFRVEFDSVIDFRSIARQYVKTMWEVALDEVRLGLVKDSWP